MEDEKIEKNIIMKVHLISLIISNTHATKD